MPTKVCGKCTLRSPVSKIGPVAKETQPAIRYVFTAIYSWHILNQDRATLSFERKNLKERVFGSPSVKVHVNKCGSSTYALISLSLGCSAFPPSAFQKTSGSLPSLTDIGCNVGYKWHQKRTSTKTISMTGAFYRTTEKQSCPLWNDRITHIY